MRKLLWNFRNDDSVTSSQVNATETPLVSKPSPNFQDAPGDKVSNLDSRENSEKPSSEDDESNSLTVTEKSIVQDDVEVTTLSPSNMTSSVTKPEFKQESVKNNPANLPPQSPNPDSNDEETGLILTPTSSKDDHRLVSSNNSTSPKVKTMKDDVLLFNKTKTDVIHPKRPFKNSISPGSTSFKPSTISGFSNFGNTSLAPFSTPKPGIEDLSPNPPAQVSVKLKSYFICKI